MTLLAACARRLCLHESAHAVAFLHFGAVPLRVAWGFRAGGLTVGPKIPSEQWLVVLEAGELGVELFEQISSLQAPANFPARRFLPEPAEDASVPSDALATAAITDAGRKKRDIVDFVRQKKIVADARHAARAILLDNSECVLCMAQALINSGELRREEILRIWSDSLNDEL